MFRCQTVHGPAPNLSTAKRCCETQKKHVAATGPQVQRSVSKSNSELNRVNSMKSHSSLKHQMLVHVWLSRSRTSFAASSTPAAVSQSGDHQRTFEHLWRKLPLLFLHATHWIDEIYTVIYIYSYSSPNRRRGQTPERGVHPPGGSSLRL